MRDVPGGAPQGDGAGIIEAQTRLVTAICWKHLAGMRSTDVEDAVQETFLRLLCADRSRIQDETGWLVVVATRVCARIHRRAYARRESAEQPDLLIEGSDASQMAVDLLSFQELIADLSGIEREVVVMRYVLLLPYGVIALRLGLSTVNTRQIALRARRRLRDGLGSDPGDAADRSA